MIPAIPQALRDQYKLREINPSEGQLKEEIESGKFTIIVSGPQLQSYLSCSYSHTYLAHENYVI